MFLSYLILSYRKDKKLNTDNIYFLHCNHKIRKESEVEAKYLKDFFKDYNFKLFIRENTKEEKEEFLRKRRYNEFNNYCRTNKIKYIFL
nr:hypothetical protein [bacterium]